MFASAKQAGLHPSFQEKSDLCEGIKSEETKPEEFEFSVDYIFEYWNLICPKSKFELDPSF